MRSKKAAFEKYLDNWKAQAAGTSNSGDEEDLITEMLSDGKDGLSGAERRHGGGALRKCSSSEFTDGSYWRHWIHFQRA